MPRLSIIIVNWNSKDYVRECLRALEKCVTISYQVIVVDGASYDGCKEMIANEFPTVEFVQSMDNVGFGRCNNLGADRAGGDYLLFLNPDTEVTAGSVESLLEVAEGNSDAALVGARLLNTDGSLQTSCVQAMPTPLNRALDSDFLRHRFPKSRLWGTYTAFSANEPVPVEAVSGACMLIRRNIFIRIGGFCPDYFMYAEDMHICWDVAKIGKRIFYQPESAVIHHGGGASSGEFSKFSCVEMNRAIHQFIVSRQGKWAGLAYRWLIGISALIRLALLAGAWGFSGGHRSTRRSTSFHRWWTTIRWAARRVDGMNLPAGTTDGTCVLS